MREGYNEEEIMAFESDKNTCTKLTLFFFVTMPRNWLTYKDKYKTKQHVIYITSSIFLTFEHI